MDPPTPILPSMGMLSFRATRLLPPSAPIRYFARTANSRPDRRSRRVAVTPPSSCAWPTYSVDMRPWVPRAQAVLKSSGSMKVCGRSFMWQGEESWCSARIRGCVPQEDMRPISSPARLSQNTFSPIRSCGVACM